MFTKSSENFINCKQFVNEMADSSNSVLIRVNKPTKTLLNQIMEKNPQFRSYGELLDFLLKEKSTSKAEELINAYLLTKRKCTETAFQVSLGDYKADIIGGKLLVGREEATELGYLIENELYLVEIKKSKEGVEQGIGQLLLYKQIVQNSWVDFFYMYLAIEMEEGDQLNKEQLDLLKRLGIGLLIVKGAHLNVEIEPEEQTNYLVRNVKQKGKFECSSCSSDYEIQEMECRRCGKLLKFNIYSSLFKKTNIALTNQIKTVLNTDPLLKYVFKDKDKVLDSLYKEIGLRRKENRLAEAPKET